MSDDRWLVVGLGNPEAEYGGTRHNVGAEVVRAFAERERVRLSRNKRVRCEVAEISVDAIRFVLTIPISYMNRSGAPIQAAAAWFKVGPEHLVVCHDDLDLPLGAIRLKRGGGSAGHNGLKDLDRALGTPEYLRVRIGIGRPPGRMPGREFVLRPFAPAERDIIAVTIEQAVDAVVSLAADGLEATQNRVHAKVTPPNGDG